MSTRTRALTPCLAAAALAACGGSSHHSNSSGSTSAQTTSTLSAEQSTSSSGTSSPPSGSSAGTSLCRASGLALAYLSGQGAMGHGDMVFTLRNVSGRTCHTFGFPGVLFLDRSGNPLPTNPIHTTHDYFGSAPRATLTVLPGRVMSFRLGVTHGMASTVGCTTAYGLQVIPPNDIATLRTAIGNGGAYECRTVTVSPMRPGTSASPR